jgi:hypothetical protein
MYVRQTRDDHQGPGNNVGGPESGIAAKDARSASHKEDAGVGTHGESMSLHTLYAVSTWMEKLYVRQT